MLNCFAPKAQQAEAAPSGRCANRAKQFIHKYFFKGGFLLWKTTTQPLLFRARSRRKTHIPLFLGGKRKA